MTVTGDYAPGSFEAMPAVADRARACLHFAAKAGLLSSRERFDLATWNSRAALGEFRSIFDALNAGLRSLGHSRRWAQSEEARELHEDPVVGALRFVRNLSVHSTADFVKQDLFAMRRAVEPDRYPHMHCLTFIPIDAHSSSARGRGESLSASAVRQFNLQAKAWPADLLQEIAVFGASEPVAAFLKGS